MECKIVSVIQLNHIGIAVRDLPELKKLFSLLGLQISHHENVPEEGVKTYFIPFQWIAAGGNIELLEAIDPQGVVAKFIQKHGPGIHHLSFSVPPGELTSLCHRLRTEGYCLVYDQPKKGAQGAQVNFIHPSSAGGILIELTE